MQPELKQGSGQQAPVGPGGAVLPPILANVIIVPLVLQRVYGVEDAYWYLAMTVGAGEIISCGILGLLLYSSLKKTKIFHK